MLSGLPLPCSLPLLAVVGPRLAVRLKGLLAGAHDRPPRALLGRGWRRAPWPGRRSQRRGGYYLAILETPVGLAARAATLLAIFLPAALAFAVLTCAAGALGDGRRQGAASTAGAIGGALRRASHGAIRWALSQGGGAFVKLGQWAATRPDILPRGLCEALAALQTRARVHGMGWNEQVIQREFGVAALGEIFEEFDAAPVGSGTVAQVHRARLRRRAPAGGAGRQPGGRDGAREEQAGGREVAVKIVHPWIERTLEHDLRLMALGGALISSLFPSISWLNIPGEIGLFAQMMRAQVDLRYEAYTLRRFARNFSLWADVHVPEPCLPYVSRSILTESYIEGCPVSDLIAYKMGGEDGGEEAEEEEKDGRAASKRLSSLKHTVATLGLQTFLQMVLWDNFAHADLHPGNLWVEFRTSRHHERSLLARVGRAMGLGAFCSPHEAVPLGWAARQDSVVPHLILLDAGLVTELSRSDLRNLRDLVRELVINADGRAVAGLLIDRSPANAAGVIDRDAFCTSMAQIVDGIFGSRRGCRQRPVLPGEPVSLGEQMAGFGAGRIMGAPLTLEELSLGPQLLAVFDLVRRHHVRLDGSFTNLIMSFVCLEGVGRQLAPAMNLFPIIARSSLQYLVKNAGSLLDDELASLGRDRGARAGDNNGVRL